ncbi:hypothetical protein JQX13_44140 [Archangium violaceum]|nr:hypothetical protein JQX13_44140 [Archangium violaceum]
MSPHLVWVLLVLLVVGLGVALFWWWRKRRMSAPAVGEPRPMQANQLLKIRERFLNGLPWLNRAAIRDLPHVVVLGPAGCGKTKLIGLDVDWERQARQFLPSYTSDPLLQIYLGPDSVVQELSAPLLEDDSPQARTALRRLWKSSFSRQQRGVTIIALDVRWLADTAPDEVRRTAQLLRGKLNLISEMSRGPVEARVCLTNMDALEGYSDFAQLLHKHGVPLSFEIPRRGEEGKLATLLEAQEQYLALGLTSLPVDAFERLERFYSTGGRSFSALARFVTALLEGNTLSFKPSLSRVYLSSPSPEARASGVLSVTTEETSSQALRARYLRTHLRRCALIAAVCTLPVVAAYGHYYLLLKETQQLMKSFQQTAERLHDQKLESVGTLVEEKVDKAGESLDELWHAERYWPPLKKSFPKQKNELRQQLATAIREAHIRPALARCHEKLDECRPEQVVYLLAVLHSSEKQELGKFILSGLRNRHKWRWNSDDEEELSTSSSHDSRPTWVKSLKLNEAIVGDYVETSDSPWETPPSGANWARWPFKDELTRENQLKPWQLHLERLSNLLQGNRVQELLNAGPQALTEELNTLSEERARLQAWLDDSVLFADLPRVLDLLNDSRAGANVGQFAGIKSTIRTLDWLNDEENREQLSSVLRMEQEAFDGFKAVERMTAAELLTRDGLWEPRGGSGPFKVTVLQESFTFRPREHSLELLRMLIRHYETTGRMPFRGVGPHTSSLSLYGAVADASGNHLPEATGAEAGDASDVLSVLDRLQFDTKIKPLVDEFTQRLKNAQLSPEEAAARQEYVRRRMDQFSQAYREGLFMSVRDYRFFAASRTTLTKELSELTQPSSKLVDMLRDVANRANLEPLDGPYYEPLRNAVAPFKPVIQLMVQDKNGNYTAMDPYRALVAQLHDELNAVTKAGGDKGKAAKGSKPSADKAAAGEEASDDSEADGPAQLTDMLTPLGQVGLSMMLEEEGSYLRKVDAWLDQQGLIGELREPFRLPFLAAKELGRAELERVLARQWNEAASRMLLPLLERYPFNPNATEEVDPADLEMLRRKDGDFWQLVERVFSPVCVERGTEWALRSPLRGGRLVLPSRVLPTLSRLAKMSKTLWDDKGQPRPLMLQMMPLPLPAPPDPGSFVTMASLKCGKTAAFGYNQSPAWQEFPVEWWDQQTASLVLEVRSPKREAKQYHWLEKARSSWSCFRLLESSTLTTDQHRMWRLNNRGDEASKRVLEISFGVKGEPWAPFREVPR